MYSNEISFIEDSFSAVYFIKLGSFFFPLMGIGAKNGLSVSIRTFSNGIVLNVFYGGTLYTAPFNQHPNT